MMREFRGSDHTSVSKAPCVIEDDYKVRSTVQRSLEDREHLQVDQHH